MAPITERNIHQHELISLTASVIRSTNPPQTGVSGLLVDESMNTVTISDGARNRVIPKKGACFRFNLQDGSTVVVEGDRLLGRPVERVKGKAGGP